MKITGFLVLIVFIIGTLAFTSHEGKDVVCQNIEVDYKTDELIQISKDEIIRLVKSADSKILNKTLDEINAEIIESKIEKHDATVMTGSHPG